jgi:membrane protease subunit HflK
MNEKNPKFPSSPPGAPSPVGPGMESPNPADPGSEALSVALRSSFAIVKLVMVVLVVIFLGSGFFKVGPDQRAMILRFGRPVGQAEQALLGPGLHWSYPYPIDEVVKVSISGIQRIASTSGWYATTPEMELAGTEPPPNPSLNPAIDGYALTADGNIVHTRATLTYRINDPVQYVFSFVNASNAIQNSLDSAILFAAARYKVDDILTRDVIGFNETVRRRVSELVDLRRLGVVVEQCAVQSIPPRFLKDAFANVLRAEVVRSKVLNEARSYQNQVTSKASADSGSRINTAESDRARLVNEVSSRSDQFKELLPQFQENPQLFTQQRLTEVLGRVLSNAQDKIYLPAATDGTQKELRLLLNREPQKPKTEEPRP